MAHLHRFYVVPELLSSEEVVLTDEEAHHALHVLRARPGDAVAVFDGRGREALGTVAGVTRHEVRVTVRETREVPLPTKRLTLVLAGLNRDKNVETLVRRGTELGVAEFRLFRADHSERMPQGGEKWARVAVEACKQCGRLWLPEFGAVPNLEAALDNAPPRLLMATQHTDPVPLYRTLADSPDEVALLVGPEGDFSSGELALAERRGAIPISLGPQTLRTEVAAVLAASLILYELGALGPR